MSTPLRTQKTVLVRIVLAGLAGLALSLPAAARDTAAEARTTGTVLEVRHSTGTSSRAAIDLPPRGTTMDQVLARYGEPVKKYPPVGEPPITRWDYGGYSMYFEGNLFLHAVVRGEPVPLAHVDQLAGGGNG